MVKILRMKNNNNKKRKELNDKNYPGSITLGGGTKITSHSFINRDICRVRVKNVLYGQYSILNTIS
jgi:hypothetical protein